MSFFDAVGDMFGKMAAQAQEVMSYKQEYERLKNDELKREYERLTQQSGTEISRRKRAVKMIMRERSGR